MNSEPDSDSDPGSGQSTDFSSKSGADPYDSAAGLCLEIVRTVVCVVRAYALQIIKAKTASPAILSNKAVS